MLLNDLFIAFHRRKYVFQSVTFSCDGVSEVGEPLFTTVKEYVKQYTLNSGSP
ncbi:hypothetical protein [Ammoniphilus sp. 3BR4]|uniref:hypothetical protein n=1 Tax=Ammoniphilus sp. 3BR4 TaxID=3158265 RepID=UPI003466C7CB